MTVEDPFVCVECGGLRCAEEMQVAVKYSDENPWSFIAARDVCYDCKSIQPRALSRRWNVNSYDEAKKIWCEKFRENAPKYDHST